MSRRAVSEIRARIATVLNRPVVTESDKKMFYELKNRIQIEWDARLFNESNRNRISRAKTRIFAQVKQTSELVVSVSNKKLSDVRSLAVAKARSVLFADTSRRLLAGLKKQIIPPYGQFRHWLRTPVTVRMFLGLMAVWTLALSSIDFGLPWDFVTTLGYGAIIMTALTTARLTVNSEALWRRTRLEPDRETGPITEPQPARNGTMMREIEGFLESDFGLGQREINMKKGAFLLRKKDWQSLQAALYDTFLKGAPPLLFELGHRLGWSFGRDLVGISQEPHLVLRHLEKISRELGWGIFQVTGDLAQGSRLTFKIRECPFCMDESPLEKDATSCDLVTGLVTGISEEAYGWPCSSFERKCVRDGYDHCEVVVTQAAVPERPKGRWNLSVLFPVLHPWKRY